MPAPRPQRTESVRGRLKRKGRGGYSVAVEKDEGNAHAAPMFSHSCCSHTPGCQCYCPLRKLPFVAGCRGSQNRQITVTKRRCCAVPLDATASVGRMLARFAFASEKLLGTGSKVQSSNFSVIIRSVMCVKDGACFFSSVKSPKRERPLQAKWTLSIASSDS
jgi:hypothetical protein